MATLWQYLKGYRGVGAGLLVLAALAQILSLADPLIFGKVIDNFALHPGGRSESELVRGALYWLLIAALVAVAARLAKAFQEYLMRMIVQKVGLEMFNAGLRQTLRLSYQEYENQSSGESVALLQKMRTDIERFVNSLINVLFSSVVGIVFLVWYAVTRHWLLVPVFVFGVLILGGLTGLLSEKIKFTQRSIVRETTRILGAISESLRNIELIKSLGLTYPEIRRLRTHTEKIYELEMLKARRVRTLSFLQGAIIGLLKQSILFILLWLVFRNDLTTGELISIQVILNSIFGPLQDMGNVVLNFREAEASLESFAVLMQQPVERRPEEPVEIGLIENLRFDDVVFRHRTATENAIDHISFSVKLGETIAFAGPSGSGKSTLVKLLVGLYRPVSGEIYIDGVPAEELRYNPVRRQIGFVTQDAQLFSGTIRENLLMVRPDATGPEMLEALRQASATQLLERSGQGLDTRLGEGGTRVSGGERQRLSIARALLRRPRLFIFDEATSALDSITEREISAVMRDVSRSQDHMVILIAHRLSTISHADRIYVLERGRIVETGSHESLLEQRGLYSAMWRQQIGERDVPRPEAPPGAAAPILAVEAG
jgi:ATP-binding cassette subfamily B protein